MKIDVPGTMIGDTPALASLTIAQRHALNHWVSNPELSTLEFDPTYM